MPARGRACCGEWSQWSHWPWGLIRDGVGQRLEQRGEARARLGLGVGGGVLAQLRRGGEAPRIEPRHVAALEADIDALQEDLAPLANFVLPGGAPAAAALHVARTVCRRAERLLVSLARAEDVGPHPVTYLNRLSDLLFVMARWENRAKGVAEPVWDSRA